MLRADLLGSNPSMRRIHDSNCFFPGSAMRFLSTMPFAILLTVCPHAFAADVFDRVSLPQIRQAIQKAEPAAELSQKEAAEIKVLGAGLTSPCIVVKTEAGNLAKALVSWGLRKGTGKPVPVLMLERYVTYDAQRPGVALASGKGVMLFAGFTFNFDIGQVVPEGQGGDVVFTPARSIQASGEARLYRLESSALPPPSASPAAEEHEGVLPQDFTGTWKVNADGRWLGTWDLTVDEKGNVSGEYLSDDTQSSYKVIGKVDAIPHRMALVVELVNADQDYEAYLWTTDKSTIAGTTTLADRTFGFYAVREKPAAGDAEAPPR